MMRELSQREAVAAMGELAATMAFRPQPGDSDAHRRDRRVRQAFARLPRARVAVPRSGELDRMERAVSASLKVARGGRGEFTELDVREPLDRADPRPAFAVSTPNTR